LRRNPKDKIWRCKLKKLFAILSYASIIEKRRQEMEKVTIEGVDIYLSPPDEIDVKWVGQTDLIAQILAAWMVLGDGDIPLNPRLAGKPGVGKTTLAYTAGQALGQPVYLFQATMDTRPEDLIITPVIDENSKIKYVASPVVSAMIKGGVAIVDEGNRMSEKSWASLAPLLDSRRYVESIVAGVKIKAHANFRFCTTMNEDASTFELPEYIQSRLKPIIYVDFPTREEETLIIKKNLPVSNDDIVEYIVEFLQAAHEANEDYTVRDGINIARYALRRLHMDQQKRDLEEYLIEATNMVLDEEATELFKEVIDGLEKHQEF